MDKRVKVVFDRKREASNKAEGTVEVQVTLNSKRSYLSTGVRVNRRQWDNGIVTMHPKKIEYNAMVAKKVAEVEKIILGMEMEEVRMTIENFRERLPRNKKKEQRDFLDWMHERLEKRVLREGTRKGHKTTYKALERFGKINTFEDLKLENIYAFDLFLREEKNPKPKASHKQYLTPDELKRFMASDERSPGVAETQRAFGFACLTGLRISDIKALRWSDIKRNEETNTLVIIQKKTKALNAVPIGNTALSWMPPKGNDDFVFHLPAKANVDAALKRIAKKVGIEKNISFHCARHTFGILVQAVTGNIETTKKLMGHKSLKSTAIYADVLTNEKVKAVDNTKKAFRGRKQREENKQIPRTKRTAATNTHPRRITFIQDNK